jgi:hypothetical protein
MKVWRGIRLLPPFGAASLTLARLLTAAAFRRKTREISTRLENIAAAEVQAAPVPAIIQSFASRAVGRNPVPRAVWLRQTGEMRVMPNTRWRPFAAEQVISVHRPGFAWLARMQAMPLLTAHILDCYVDGESLLEARLCGSLPLAQAARQEVSRGELMRYLAELIWAPYAMQHNPQLSWCEIDASAVEVSAASAGGPARVRLIFEDGDIARIEADDCPCTIGHRVVPTRWEGCCGDYREMEGCRVPTSAAASWLLDDGPFEYWRGKVTAYGTR